MQPNSVGTSYHIHFNSSFPQKSINVFYADTPIITENFSVVTKWYAMSGQQARYCAHRPFEEADEHFSWALEIDGVMTLLWDPLHQSILYRKKQGFSKERLRFWIYHTFFPMVLELSRYYTILHVGAVEIEGVPTLFSAPSFGGKSTMVDYFLKAGHTLYSDDSLAIEKRDNTYVAIASYPYHRPYRKPETLGFRVDAFGSIAKEVGLFYVLDKQEQIDKIEITELKGIEKYKAFHHSIFVAFSFRKRERFVFFLEMARKIPVFKISYPHDLSLLPKVYETIVAHTKRQTQLLKYKR
ncbi:hypothetical protein MNB_SV-4-1259 [hydrothermal vent metagenome]|uniref:Serine kinase of the HPr protein, regulates carbohydrate metabolism n=1 Tax=hydrothermal vent metagenome TaxID=652676 RepID=A0A1W1E868_9ZZZZ